MREFIVHALVLTFGVVIAGVSQLLLKKAAQRQYKSWIRQYLNVRVILGYGIMVLSTLCTVYAYRVVPLSMSPAWDAFGQVVVVALSWLILGEKISRKKLLGVIVIIAGILVFFL